MWYFLSVSTVPDRSYISVNETLPTPHQLIFNYSAHKSLYSHLTLRFWTGVPIHPDFLWKYPKIYKLLIFIFYGWLYRLFSKKHDPTSIWKIRKIKFLKNVSIKLFLAYPISNINKQQKLRTPLFPYFYIWTFKFSMYRNRTAW